MKQYRSRRMLNGENSLQYRYRMASFEPTNLERWYCIHTFNLGRNPEREEFRKWAQKRIDYDKWCVKRSGSKKLAREADLFQRELDALMAST